jgi:hypothetical protein
VSDELDEQARAHINRLVDQAPPLSEAQKRAITAAFDDTAEADDG